MPPRRTPDPLAKAVGERVRELRREQDFTFDAFVEQVGLRRGYVSELERGVVVPSLTSLKKVASALGVAVADLVIGDTVRERLFAVTRLLDARDVRALVEQARGRLGGTD